MPLLYSEGSRAFGRLQTEIIKRSADQSIFAWTFPDPILRSSLLAHDIRCFSRSGVVTGHVGGKQHYEETNRGLRLTLKLSRQKLDLGFKRSWYVEVIIPIHSTLWQQHIGALSNLGVRVRLTRDIVPGTRLPSPKYFSGYRIGQRLLKLPTDQDNPIIQVDGVDLFGPEDGSESDFNVYFAKEIQIFPNSCWEYAEGLEESFGDHQVFVFQPLKTPWERDTELDLLEDDSTGIGLEQDDTES